MAWDNGFCLGLGLLRNALLLAHGPSFFTAITLDSGRMINTNKNAAWSTYA